MFAYPDTERSPKMTQHPRTKSDVRDGIDRTAIAVAAGHDAFLHEAIESVSWERRGLLGRLSRDPRPERIQETGA
jgi:hypothetical protein